MRGFFQKLKAAAVIGIAWAIPWALAGVGIGVYEGGDFIFSLWERMWIGAALLGVVGGTGGVLFALALTGTVRQGSAGELTNTRVGFLGALAGVVTLPVIAVGSGQWAELLELSRAMLTTLAVMGALGASCSLATLAVARATPSLPEDQADVPHIAGVE